MSRSTFTARFADGTLLYGLSNDTVGMLWPALFDSVEGAWVGYEAYAAADWVEHKRIYYPDLVGAVEPVVIATECEGEFPGTATRNRVVSPLEPPWDVDEQ